MSLPKDWPHYVKVGNISIPIYHTRTKRGYDEFKVVWKASDGKRQFKTFADFADARKHAGNVNAAISAGDIKATVLTDKDRHTYLDALDALKGIETPLNIAVREYADSVERLGAVPIRDAVSFYLKHNAGVASRTVTEVFNEFVVSKRTRTSRARKPVSAKHLADIESRLGKFADAFQCKIADVRPADVEQFLSGLGEVTGRTWFNYARLIRSLFNFAQSKRYIPSGIDPMEGIEIEYEDDSEIEIFTPGEMVKFLNAARPEIVPFLAIGAFAGLRTAELQRLDWSEVGAEYIEVKKAKSKTGSRRLVPIQPNLAKWLAPYRQKSGKVVPFANMAKQIGWLVEDSKVEWKHNALRHSFCSYRFADCKNQQVVTMESGHTDPDTLFRNYREVVTESSAKAWFSIDPCPSKKVIQIPKTPQDDPMLATLGYSA